MSSVFDIVQAMSGQKNVIVIPVPYLEFFKGDQQAHALGAVLNQLVFWSGISSSADEGWFYKSHEELAEEIGGLSGEEQARRLVDKLRKKYFPGIIETKAKKVNGTPVTHYRIDGNALIAMIFPVISETSKVRKGNVEDAVSKRRKCGMENAKMQNHGNVEDAVSYLYTDLNTDNNLQITKPSSLQNSNESRNKSISNHSKINPEAVIHSPNGQQWGTQRDLDCAKHMFEKIKIINPTAKEPNYTDWANDIRLMRSLDGRTHEQIWHLFCWANKDSFWYKNILSPRRLREKFDELTIKSQEVQNQGPKIDTVARDSAFTRIIGSRSKPQGRIEEIASELAGKTGIRTMKEFQGRQTWISIWKQAAEQAAKEQEAA